MSQQVKKNLSFDIPLWAKQKKDCNFQLHKKYWNREKKTQYNQLCVQWTFTTKNNFSVFLTSLSICVSSFHFLSNKRSIVAQVKNKHNVEHYFLSVFPLSEIQKQIFLREKVTRLERERVRKVLNIHSCWWQSPSHYDIKEVTC